MATDVEVLLVRLEATQTKFEKQLAGANRAANRQANAIERRFQQMNRNVAGSIRGLAAPLAAAFTARGFQQFLDSATRIENALKVAGLSGKELTDVYDKLYVSAQRNAAPLEALVTLYGRVALVQKELGASTDQLTTFADNVALALRVSGQSAQESSGALLQLSQALGSGIVRAEEFSSILEGALPIAQAAAAGLEEAGGSVAKLRQLVVDGKVSSEAFFAAFEAGSVILEDKVAGAELTVSQALERLNNVLIDTVGKFNKTTGASDEAAYFIEKLGDAIRELGDIASWLTGPISEVIGYINAVTEAALSAAAALGEMTGAARIGQSLGANPYRSQTNIQGRIDGAFNGLETTQPTNVGTVTPKPVSLSNYKLPAKSGKGGGRSGKGRQNEYQRETQQIRDRTAALQAETAAQAGLNPLINDFEYSITKARAEQELLNAAQKAGIAITPELRASIATLAEGYAEATAQSNKLAEQQDLLRQSAEDMRDLGKDVFGGFIQDLKSGVSAAEALENALGKVADKLLEVALNSIFGGGNAGGFGAIGKLFGFSQGGIAAHGRPKAFARGGISNSAAIFGEAGPEAAVPLPDGKRIPVDLRMPQNAKAGASIVINAPINAPGADPAMLKRVEKSVNDLHKAVPGMIDSRNRVREIRGTRPT